MIVGTENGILYWSDPSCILTPAHRVMSPQEKEEFCYKKNFKVKGWDSTLTKLKLPLATIGLFSLKFSVGYLPYPESSKRCKASA